MEYYTASKNVKKYYETKTICSLCFFISKKYELLEGVVEKDFDFVWLDSSCKIHGFQRVLVSCNYHVFEDIFNHSSMVPGVQQVSCKVKVRRWREVPLISGDQVVTLSSIDVTLLRDVNIKFTCVGLPTDKLLVLTQLC